MKTLQVGVLVPGLVAAMDEPPRGVDITFYGVPRDAGDRPELHHLGF